eukprot:CAMPEP_0202090722 /NCGR_PEP_ID=MMETSP0964-20121228/44267_1 /ASSEMBLY_ACC=CAM_ASM_000500 /TAXON_ID=4773 /ORGANISM="Schizochytrium aggregatum, Strain ATCC28209" /LENGTH=168 /DNA_ID=CAMNT_0048658895 /DNA_START=377 /DNA_END=880 /DNA_ORIENTATION=+
MLELRGGLYDGKSYQLIAARLNQQPTATQDHFKHTWPRLSNVEQLPPPAHETMCSTASRRQHARPGLERLQRRPPAFSGIGVADRHMAVSACAQTRFSRRLRFHGPGSRPTSPRESPPTRRPVRSRGRGRDHGEAALRPALSQPALAAQPVKRKAAMRPAASIAPPRG